MKKVISLALSLALCLSLAACGGAPASSAPASSATASSAENNAPAADDEEAFVVGICQLMEHESLDKATQGFIDAASKGIENTVGKKVKFETQVAGDANLCTTVINAFTAKKVDLIMANATPALLAAANATSDIPVVGTSVTDYNDTFGGTIPENVCGMSDAVPFDEQAQMMIDTLGLVSGDKVGVLYCINESNSLIQYNAVKALFEEAGIVVEAYTFSEVTELQAIVNKMASEVKAVYIPSDNTVAQNDSIVGTICTEKNVPVFTSYGGAICYASLAIDYYELGYKAGEMAEALLLGVTDAGGIGVETLTPSVSYNKELCAQLGIAVPAN